MVKLISEAAIKQVLEQDAPDWWSPYDLYTATLAVLEQDDLTDVHWIAGVLWSMGHGIDHEGCRYADGDGDADYENGCSTCEKHSLAVAARIAELK